jgi:DNA topoisomerase IB
MRHPIDPEASIGNSCVLAAGEAASDPIVDPASMAEAGGLVYVSAADPGIRRLRSGECFAYIKPGNRAVRDPASAQYARDNDSYGLTTLRNRHVRFYGRLPTRTLRAATKSESRSGKRRGWKGRAVAALADAYNCLRGTVPTPD